MGDRTGIAWTEVPDGQGGFKRGATWNPVTGCDKVSAGCDFCYAEVVALRLQKMGQPKYAAGFAVRTHEDALTQPLKWSKPRGIFVNSMSDLFHVDVPETFTNKIWAVMALAPQHSFQILTKRPHRAASYLNTPARREMVQGFAAAQLLATTPKLTPQAALTIAEAALRVWPLPNVWLGTSVEQGTDAMRPRHLDVRHRIKSLVQAPAAIHFLSCEPLIGPLDLEGYLEDIEWVITGGESGPNHRPLDLDWVRWVDATCTFYGVPHFFKQVGGLTPKSGGYLLDGKAIRGFPNERTLADALR